MNVRDLPSVDQLVRSLDTPLPRSVTIEVARSAIAAARERLLAEEPADPTELASASILRLERRRPHLVINATGVLLHTNLGRAPLAPKAAAAAESAATGYGNVEFDLETGARGSRAGYLDELLTSLTGAEAALVVNNNAGALFLTLIGLASGREVPVSRGELIEIGGSYRLPELMAASGCHLVEVGTTNRTRIGDYDAAISDRTSLLLKVHPSNYRIAGFSEDASLSQLVELGSSRSLPVAFDVGSGLIDERAPWLDGPPPSWLAAEPGVVQSVASGCDLVMFSGDKLFGGPQAGIIVGSGELVDRLRRHPVTRALRPDGSALAALTVTAEFYADDRADELPFWRMATTDAETLGERCRNILERSGIAADVIAGTSTVGAGSVPGSEVASEVISIDAESADRLYLELLAGQTPIVARRSAGAVVVDVRTVDPSRDTQLAGLLSDAVARCRS